MTGSKCQAMKLHSKLLVMPTTLSAFSFELHSLTSRPRGRFTTSRRGPVCLPGKHQDYNWAT